MSEIQNAFANASPMLVDTFLIPGLLDGLREKLSDQEVADMITNSSDFQEIITEERSKRSSGDLTGLFGDNVHIPESIHENGRVRIAEDDYRVNVDYLKDIGIDPKKVLYFRRTQPSETPKPEYYWTSAFGEVVRGLKTEISPEKRASSIILVSEIYCILS